MTPAADQPPLFLPGWWVEPCDTAPPPAQVRRRTYVPLCIRDIETVAIPIGQYPEGADEWELNSATGSG